MTGEEAKGLLNFFLGNMDNEFQTTKKVIAAVPQATSEYKPDRKAKSGRELAWHIARADVFSLDAVIAGKFDMSGGEPPVPATITEILDWYETAYNDRLSKLKSLSNEALTHPIPFFGLMELPAVTYLQFM